MAWSSRFHRNEVPVSNARQEAKVFINRWIHHPTVCVPEIVHVYSGPRGRSLPGTSTRQLLRDTDRPEMSKCFPHALTTGWTAIAECGQSLAEAASCWDDRRSSAPSKRQPCWIWRECAETVV